MRQVAGQANKLGRYDAVIHNAGVGYREPHRIQTADGLSHVFADQRAGALPADRADDPAVPGWCT